MIESHEDHASHAFEKCVEQVWCPIGPATPPVLGYWRQVMRYAYDQMHSEKCSIRGPAYKIHNDVKNEKARSALRCDECTQQADFAIYEGLRLYCADHVPAAALAATRKTDKHGRVCHSPVR